MVAFDKVFKRLKRGIPEAAYFFDGFSDLLDGYPSARPKFVDAPAPFLGSTNQTGFAQHAHVFAYRGAGHRKATRQVARRAGAPRKAREKFTAGRICKRRHCRIDVHIPS